MSTNPDRVLSFFRIFGLQLYTQTFGGPSYSALSTPIAVTKDLFLKPKTKSDQTFSRNWFSVLLKMIQHRRRRLIFNSSLMSTKCILLCIIQISGFKNPATNYQRFYICLAFLFKNTYFGQRVH